MPKIVHACAVCFLGIGNPARLTAYYVMTGLMTAVAILLVVGFYVLIYRRYANGAEPKMPLTEPASVAPARVEEYPLE